MHIRKYFSQITLQIVLILATILAILPMYWIVAGSLQPRERLFQYPPQWIPSFYLDNFKNVLTLTQLPRWIVNSSAIAATSAVIACFLGGLAAYAFTRFHFRLRKALLFGVLATQMIPGLTNIIPIYLMVRAFGGVNNLFWILIVYTAGALPLAIWMLNGFFQAVPIELEEAAMLDGCNLFQVFWKIVLPLVLPGMASIAVLVFVICWNEFVIALTFISDSALKTYQLGLFDFLTTDALVWQRYGNLYAAAALGLVPTFVSYMLIQKNFISGLTAGALKG